MSSEDIHHASTTAASVSSVADYVLNVKAIDNHAHPVLAEPEDHFKLASLTSEASGPALAHATSTLAHVRAVKMLAKCLGCEPTDAAVLAKRKEIGYTALRRKCFELAKLEVVLFDTGLVPATPLLPLDDHLPTNFEVLRLEHDIEKILRDVMLFTPHERHERHVQPIHVTAFSQAIVKRGETYLSPKCAALKTVICYRTGLDVIPDERFVPDIFWLEELRKVDCRLQHKPFNDWLLTRACAIVGKVKPIQLHTGLGDSDLDLRLANPALLRKLVMHFPNVRFVLLHTGWPYMREAAYMAAMHANVYLDLSLVAPVLSAKGIKRALEEIFEIAPLSKLLFGTDGHFWPETFALSSVQFRQAFAEGLEDLIKKGDLTEHEAMLITRNIFWDNANRLYNLKLPTPPLPQLVKKNA